MSHDASAPFPPPEADTVTPIPAVSKEEYLEKAKQAGWTESAAFDYSQFTGDQDATVYHGTAQKYEWKDDYGDVGPPIKELEDVLFGGEFQMRRGDHIKHLEFDVAIEGASRVTPIARFADGGLHPVILENISKCGYDVPTPIQRYTIPAVLKGFDVVAISQTGSGKTASYMIPVLSRLMGKAKKLQAPRPLPGREARAEPLVVIVVPTRELAIQIFDEARRMCYRSMLRPCVAYGGLPSAKTREELQKGCDILIATPGRLCDLMNKPNILTMARVKYTIIDEADEMLDQDWSEELQKIMAGGDTNEDADHIFMMFSATFPKLARNMAREYMAEDYVRITVGRPGQAHKNIRQNVIFVEQDRKREAVHDLLYDCEPARTIIFCNSKAQVDHLDDFLYNRGMPTTSIHADRNQREREDALRAFRTGRAPILIATGVSSRGWDIMGVKHVINYDLPSAMYGGIQEYTHRIGRTARIGHQGLATSFYNDRNEDIAQELVNVLVECECDIPDFLSHLKPEDTNQIDFDDDSDEEEAADGFGTTGGASSESGEVVADSWGRSDEVPAAEDTGFGADTGNVADTSGW